MSKTNKIVLWIIAIIVMIGVGAYNAIIVNPHNINIREETIVSYKLDESFDDFIIAFFSDLHYGNYTGKNELDNLVSTINNSGVDVCIFGGDLIDLYSTRGISAQDKTYLIDKLKEIEAPYGKFAVLGNHDIDQESTKNEVSQILIDGGFKIITNTNVRVYNSHKSYFNLIGIDSMFLGKPNPSSAYDKIKENDFNFVVTHAPDIVEELYLVKSDYVVAGHSHGGQIFLPFINYLYRPIGCREYFKGKYIVNNVVLDITNGVGTTKYDARLFADSEIVLYKLKKTD